MKWYTIFLVLILLIAIGFIALQQTIITGRAVSSEYTQTKAICNASNFCQDYIITCENDSVISLEPITGAVIQHEPEWKDPREKKELCS